jgi:hypothetical protein
MWYRAILVDGCGPASKSGAVRDAKTLSPGLLSTALPTDQKST